MYFFGIDTYIKLTQSCDWVILQAKTIYTNTKCSATLSCFFQQLTMRYKIETNKSKISGPIYHELALVCVYHDRETTDNFRVAVIYFRFWIVYTCGIQSVSTVNRSRQMSVCVWLSTLCLSVCQCICVTVCVSFRIIIMYAQTVHLCLFV